jgi:16S rRNA (guanine1207-N2)-methyltransferase
MTSRRKAHTGVMTRRLLNPTSDLFARYVELAAGERVLLLNSDHPALARWLVEVVGESGQVTAFHTLYSVLCRLSRVSGLDLCESVYPDPAQHRGVDTVLLDIPAGRDHVRAYLWTAARVLRVGGHLYLAGANAAGAKSAISDAADLFGDAPVLGYKGGCRIALVTRWEGVELRVPHEWQLDQPWQPQMRAFTRPEGHYTIITMPGVFSWDHLDDGTALLLEYLGVEADTDVLDIGCGYGIIGLVAAQMGAHVTMVDDDLLALRCARASVRTNELVDRCTVLPSDVTSAVQDQQFDLILSNPPFHHGVEVTTDVAERIILESYDRLRPGGRLRIVANRFLPYDRTMRETFGNVTVIAQNGRYRVLESVRD